MGENVVTDKNSWFIFWNFLCQHILEKWLTIKLQKVATDFNCKICDYSTCRKSQYDKHILTAKHKKLTNADNLVQNTNSKHICSLWKRIRTQTIVTSSQEEL